MFIEMLAFAVVWESDEEFFMQLDGIREMNARARACVVDTLAVEGLDGSRY